MSADGPEEREFDREESYERDLDDADVADMLADESRAEISDEDLQGLAHRAMARLPSDGLVRLAIDSVLRGAHA